VGTNRYANLTEKPLDVPEVDVQSRQRERAAQLAEYQKTVDATGCRQALDKLTEDGAELLEAAIAAADSGATLGDICRALARGEAPGPTVKPVCVHRGAQPFEALRQATEAYAARTGARPQIFLASMGPISQYKARTDFTRGFLEVGGFAASGGEGFAGIDEAVQAALAAGTLVVVICSTDAAYPEIVPDLTQQLKAANPEMTVLVAGYPKDQVEAFRRAGVDDFIYLGANCYEILRNLQNKMRVLA
jgi:methylmalonyl-CoA mutase